MKRFENQKYLIIAMLGVFFAFVVQAVIYLGSNNKDVSYKQMSLIMYGKDADRWDNFKEGAELACEKSGVEVSLVTMSEDFDYMNQCELIRREVANGADGIIIAACDSEKISEFLKEENINIPIVFAESGCGKGSPYDFVTADNYQMGVDLANVIIENELPRIKVAIVSDGTCRDSVKSRKDGVYDVLSQFTSNIVFWDRNKYESKMITRKYLQRWLVEEAVDVVVTLDSETTDALMDAMDNLNKTRKVYSISTSNKAVYYLDHSKIKALKYQDEFGIGYVAAAKVLRKLGEDAPECNDKAIASRIVLKPDIYNGDSEKILFPFVK